MTTITDNPFDITAPDDVKHDLRWHQGDAATARANTWALIAAYADEFSFNYEFLAFFVKQRNDALGGGCDPKYFCAAPVPSRLEFLEILEFREFELCRAQRDPSVCWAWPRPWEPHWNQPVLRDHVVLDGAHVAIDYSTHALTKLYATQQGITVLKTALGHFQPVKLSDEDTHCISRLLNLFLESVRFTRHIALPPILTSLDYPERAHAFEVDRNPTWEIDKVLGAYRLPVPHNRDGYILLFQRVITDCARILELPEAFLRRVVLVHEVAHFLTHALPDVTGEVWGGTKSHRDSKSVESFGRADAAVKEGWAQLLTAWAIAGGSWADILEQVFSTLSAHQPSPYQSFKDALKACTDRERHLHALTELRRSNHATLAEWLALVR